MRAKWQSLENVFFSFISAISQLFTSRLIFPHNPLCSGHQQPTILSPVPPSFWKSLSRKELEKYGRIVIECPSKIVLLVLILSDSQTIFSRSHLLESFLSLSPTPNDHNKTHTHTSLCVPSGRSQPQLWTSLRMFQGWFCNCLDGSLYLVVVRRLQRHVTRMP